MSFFRDMNLERWVILLALLAALGFGGVGFFKYRAERVELEQALETRVPKLAYEVQVKAQRYSKLYKDADLSGLGSGSSTPESFIRDLAANERTRLGQIDFASPTEATPRKGVKDVKFAFYPPGRNKAFGRQNIANFLYLIESENRRLRVTRVKLDIEPKSLKPHEMPPGDADKWRWEADVTVRQKSDDAK